MPAILVRTLPMAGLDDLTDDEHAAIVTARLIFMYLFYGRRLKWLPSKSTYRLGVGDDPLPQA